MAKERHAVIGSGNLGLDIAYQVSLNPKKQVRIFSASKGWKYPRDSVDTIFEYVPDYIWVTIGAGSVGEAQKNYAPFVDLHLRLPMELIQKSNDHIKLIFFSTDYVNTTIDSLYALSKKHMEEAIVFSGKPNAFIFRVGSLYGYSKYKKCFPYKLCVNDKKQTITHLPSNKVAPTPTSWLAKTLLNLNLDACKRKCYIAPSNPISVCDWGSLVLNRDIEDGGIDVQRPATLEECYLPIDKPTCLELWLENRNQILSLNERI